MDTIQENAREVSVAADVDLCVIGGSCTGVFAAVAAARLGLKVALVETNGFFGGVATAGLVCVWHSTMNTTFDRTIIAGLTAETLNRLKRRNVVEEFPRNHDLGYSFNSEELKIELDELVVEAGVRSFLHARFAAAVTEGRRVRAAIIEDKTGRRAIRAALFIDASGDGDLLARAGLETRTFTDLQPPTTAFVVHGLESILRAKPDYRHGDYVLFDAAFDERWPHALRRGFLWSRPIFGRPDAVMVSGTRVNGADCSDADQLTRAEIEGRRQVRVILDNLRTLPGGEAAALAALPACIGIRETRHAVCLHTLTEEEVLAGVRFDDAIAYGSYRVDVHHSDKEGLTFRYLDGRQLYCVPGRQAVQSRWRPESPTNPTFYQVPYRCLVPRGADNVLAAGRLIDTDRGAYGAIRVMVNCNQTGEAAGTAAALALRAGVAVAQVDPSRLRRTLADHGAVID